MDRSSLNGQEGGREERGGRGGEGGEGGVEVNFNIFILI
jgi:hypothetical protein